MMARRRTKAQRQWRPNQVRPPRSVKALFASTVLCLEGVLMFFFGLAAWGLNQNEWYAWWLLGGSVLIGIVCVLTCAVLHRSLGYTLGWILQGVILLSFIGTSILSDQGLYAPMAALPALAFFACWWYSVHRGAQIDREKLARFEVDEQLYAREAEAARRPPQ